jgi:hypothetical protein
LRENPGAIGIAVAARLLDCFGIADLDQHGAGFDDEDEMGLAQVSPKIFTLVSILRASMRRLTRIL